MADGLLAKLSILPFNDSENVQMGPPSGPPFIAQFNPESFAISNEFEYDSPDAADGGDGKEAKFKSIKPRTFTFDFLLDGTGAAGLKIDVLAQITLFRQTVGFLGAIHRPRFLVINWGAFIATCVLQSYTITYKLFRPDGTPLRASLSATFREHKSNALNELLKNLSSPDLIHAHLVKEGEHLTLITQRVYNDPRYYIHVAEANSLDTVRALKTGTTVYLPPLT
jgi:nucleoid-associated protein YgaU